MSRSDISSPGEFLVYNARTITTANCNLQSFYDAISNAVINNNSYS